MNGLLRCTSMGMGLLIHTAADKVHPNRICTWSGMGRNIQDDYWK